MFVRVGKRVCKKKKKGNKKSKSELSICQTMIDLKRKNINETKNNTDQTALLIYYYFCILFSMEEKLL